MADRILSRASLICAIGSLSAGPALAQDASDRHVVRNLGSSERLVRGLESMEFLLTAEDTEGRYSIVDWLFQPELDPPAHIHHWHSEVFYFVSGAMEWTMNGETQVLEAGDLLYIPPNTHHVGHPVGDEEVHAILIYEPGGFERGAIQSVALTNEQRNDPAFMSDFFTRYDIDFQDEDTGPGTRHVFHKNALAEAHTRGSMVSKFMLTADQSDGRFSIVDEVFAPSGLESIPPNAGHVHNFHSEVFYVVSGIMEWRVDGDIQQVHPGGLVYIPPGSHHAFRVVGDEDVHAIMLYEPAGYELNYFRRQAMLEEEREDPEAMAEFLRDADVNFSDR